MSGALASNCFLLGPSSVCGSDYNGYPVQLTREYADETSFNNYFNTNIIDIDGASNGFVKDGCVKGQALSDALQRRRFHSTFFCSKIVSDALTAKCPVQTFSSITLPPLGPIMCSGACGQVYSSVQSILQDPAACPGASGGVSSMLSAVSATCNNYASSLPQNSNQCTNGTSIEKSFCGFSSIAFATSGCAALGSNVDPCCKALLTKATVTSKPTTNQTSDSSSDDSTNNTSSTTTGTPTHNSSRYSKLNVPLIVGVSIGGVLLLVLIVVFLLMNRRRRNKKAMIQPYTNSPYDGSSSLKKGDTKYAPSSAAATSHFNASNDIYKSHSPPPPAAFSSFHHQQHQYASLPPPPVPTSSKPNVMMERSPATPPEFFKQTINGSQNFGSDNNKNRPLSVIQEDDESTGTDVSNSVNVARNIMNQQHQQFGTSSSSSSATSLSAAVVNGLAPSSNENNRHSMMIVIHPYYPTLGDELKLEVGAELVLLRNFDDGWALGIDPITGQQGAFPLVCVANPNDKSALSALQQRHNNSSIDLEKDLPSVGKRFSSFISS